MCALAALQPPSTPLATLQPSASVNPALVGRCFDCATDPVRVARARANNVTCAACLTASRAVNGAAPDPQLVNGCLDCVTSAGTDTPEACLECVYAGSVDPGPFGGESGELVEPWQPGPGLPRTAAPLGSQLKCFACVSSPAIR